MLKQMKSWKILSFAALLFFSACKKDKSDQASLTPPDPSPAPAVDKLKDSTLIYSKDIFLWYNQIPASFDAQSYSDPAKIMTAIRQYSTEPGFSQPVDRWSFALAQQEWDKVSSGVSGDFGISVFFRSPDDLRVKSVEKNSAAGNAGIRRGWRITKINNNSNISTSNSDFVVSTVFNSNSTNFTFQKPDNSTVDLTLNASSYQEHPVYFDSVYTTSKGKLGYLVFNSFLGDTTQIYNELNRVFNSFAAAGVTHLAIDLRYNGGGYVTVQEKLANYIVNSSANGNLMMKQQFNDKYIQYNEATNFMKQGSVNADRVFFIVSNSTASASELLINNIKPYMNVSLVGPNKTYGKPVGFFPIPVGSWYIFPVSFRTTNKNGEGNYFNGLTLDNAVADGLDKDWGDVKESSFGSVIKYLNSGSFRAQSSVNEPAYSEKPEVRSGNLILDKPFFKGTIDTRGMR
jgi:hypothetical protein